jgi:cation diffusion facilitator CzcD-associated flavoprotein CzcO
MSTIPVTETSSVGSRLSAIERKYEDEAAKRLRPDGVDQFVDLDNQQGSESSVPYRDPWIDAEAPSAQGPLPLQDGSDCKFLIVGAGLGGLIGAVKLIQAGFSVDDIRMVDAAGGFGGTWYWNRFPGLLCDIESYSYMPLLEETGYMPKNRYASGDEILEHANRIASQYRLTDKALFRTVVRRQQWDENRKRWAVSLALTRSREENEVNLTVYAQFVILACASYGGPQVPKVAGLDKFRGSVFHTARWDYSCTGGSPADPRLDKLKDKTVGIIGTGATAVQVVPFLAQWAKKLNVFQRTPSTVFEREQRPTDLDDWTTQIAAKPGWQEERQLNWLSHASDNAKGPKLVKDIWTELPSFSALLGAPKGIVTMESVPEHVARLYALDLPMADRARARVEELVQDKKIAAKLKAWYPTWCKRIIISDEYLQTFNQPNVTLVDTDGKGVERITETGVMVAGEEYPVDVLILSTGFRAPLRAYGNPAARLGLSIIGRDGTSLDDKWRRVGAATLHGVCCHRFPNLFFVGAAQAGFAGIVTFMLETQMRHIAYILGQAHRKSGLDTSSLTVEVTDEAEEAWSSEVARRALWFSSMGGCTPSYFTNEGAFSKPQDPEEMMRIARTMMWGEGYEDYLRILEKWRGEGRLEGFMVGNASQ